MEYLSFLAGFALLWLGISAVLAVLAGWSNLARRYRAREPAKGEIFRFVSGSLGAPLLPVGYGRSLSLTVGEGGFGLSVFFLLRFYSPPLFIPWDAVESVEPKSSLFGRYTAIRVRDRWPTISIRGDPGERLARAYAKRRIAAPVSDSERPSP